jgi:hypothetical protein
MATILMIQLQSFQRLFLVVAVAPLGRRVFAQISREQLEKDVSTIDRSRTISRTAIMFGKPFG